MILSCHPLACLLAIQIFVDCNAPGHLPHHDRCGVQQDVLGGAHSYGRGVSSQHRPCNAGSGIYSARWTLLFSLLHEICPSDDLPCHGACKFLDSISCTELCSPKVSNGCWCDLMDGFDVAVYQHSVPRDVQPDH